MHGTLPTSSTRQHTSRPLTTSPWRTEGLIPTKVVVRMWVKVRLRSVPLVEVALPSSFWQQPLWREVFPAIPPSSSRPGRCTRWSCLAKVLEVLATIHGCLRGRAVGGEVVVFVGVLMRSSRLQHEARWREPVTWHVALPHGTAKARAMEGASGRAFHERWWHAL